MTERPVHAVVVAYHAADHLARCLSGLERAVPVTVVDNSSSSDVAAVAASNGATYIDSGENKGFAAGVNVALSRLAENDADVLLINPDVVISPDAVTELARYLHMRGNDMVAAVAPRVVDAAGAEQRVVWPFPHPVRMWAEAVGVGRLATRRNFLMGAVLLLRRQAVADVGMFDEQFFLYAEEADWQRRALARGWVTAVCRDAIAEHAGSGASTDAARRKILFHAGQETYVRKWYGRSGWWVYRAAVCVGAVARAVVLSGERRSDALSRAALYVKGPRRCAGLRGRVTG
jgi:GT2 family glycosyltransferase